MLKEFNERKQAIQEIKTIISKYLSSEKKLLIIVDELDRTRPDYAVHFLEDIKHFFDIENVIFLVAVNRKQMEATVKCLYGQELNFDGYYRKFFKQEINLPDPYKEAQRLVDALIRKTNVKYNPQTNDRGYRVNNSYLSCKMFNLTLREVETFVRIFEIILGDKEKITKWMYMDAYSFFICLFMKEKSVFQKILNGECTVDDFIKFVNNKSGFNFTLEKEGAHHDERHSNNYLLGTIACFLLKNGRNLQEDKKSVINAFSSINGAIERSICNPIEGLNISNISRAVEICEKISQYKSVFKR